ncbi:hypothetical protein [Pseudonocardia sp. NPDC049154]|uniref:hypothetical protein n=1 Tax=Pseudonocardia sp. NPDC049154 TaxID=3155501 RepID=UPI00340CDFE2
MAASNWSVVADQPIRDGGDQLAEPSPALRVAMLRLEPGPRRSQGDVQPALLLGEVAERDPARTLEPGGVDRGRVLGGFGQRPLGSGAVVGRRLRDDEPELRSLSRRLHSAASRHHIRQGACLCATSGREQGTEPLRRQRVDQMG